MSAAQALFQAMADRAELSVEDLHKTPRRLLDVACRIRTGETLHHDDDVVDFAAHALKAASLAASAAAPAPGPIAQPLTDAELLKIARETVTGNTIKLTRDVGPYEVTEPTHAYRCLADALVAATGIGAQVQQGHAHLLQQLADLRGQRGAMAALMRELLAVVLTIDEPESDDEAQLLLALETKTTAMLAEIDRQAAGSLLDARTAPQLPHPTGAS